MQGQWIGRYAGTSEGLVVANIEDRATFYEGVAYLNEDDPTRPGIAASFRTRSEEHTSELQSRSDLVCRLLLEKKKTKTSVRMVAESQSGRHHIYPFAHNLCTMPASA